MTSGEAPPSEAEPFHVRGADSGDWWCLMTLTGELDPASGPRLHEAVDEALRRGRRHIAVDASALSFIDSSGLVALLTARDRTNAAGGSFRLTAASPAVTRLLEVCGLTDELMHRRR